MSNYRDDSQDTAVASSYTFGGLRAVVDEVIRISDALLFGIAITVSSSALASDEVIDNNIQTLEDSALIQDFLLDGRSSSYLHTDQAKTSESTKYSLQQVIIDSAILYDSVPASNLQSIQYDAAIVSDYETGQRTAFTMVYDTVVAKDTLTAVIRDMADEQVVAIDTVSDKLKAANLLIDTAIASDYETGQQSAVTEELVIISDELIGQRNAISLIEDIAKAADVLLFGMSESISDNVQTKDLVFDKLSGTNIVIDSIVIADNVTDAIHQNNIALDTAIASDETTGVLNTFVLINDMAVVEDIVISTGGGQGQAWTANVDSWAMSRYNPYNFNRLVVINGVLYGEFDTGIYQLDREVDVVAASVTTGKMDLSGGTLTHPAYSYLEYELNGTASMAVTTTQKGIEQSYTYALPNELADELTNGRFIFGRGLRGRHFTFELTMIGTHGHVNDLYIEHQPSSRRV